MNFNNVSFPHPILGVIDDITGETSIKSEIKATDDDYEITIILNYDNGDLLDLINDGKAEFICEATCSKTLYREIVKSNIPEIKFKISRKQLKGKVEFVGLLVAKEEITPYSNKDAHPDYHGFTFDLDQGEVLAYFGEFYFDADIKYEKLKAVSAFMDIVGKDDLNYTNIDLKKNKIEVQLPTEDFDKFRCDAIGKESAFASVFHASIVLSALLTALYNFDEHKDDYQWAKVIDYRLKNEEEFKTLSIAEKENIPEIAQRLLGNPFSRLLDGLVSIYDSTNNEE